MNEIEREGFLAHAQLPGFRRKVASARSIIAEAMAIAPCYVAVSWGKDSVAMLHLATSLGCVNAINFRTPHQQLIDDFDGVRDRFLQHTPCQYQEINIANEQTIPKAVNEQRLWHQYPVAIIGIRAEENPKKRGGVFARDGYLSQYKSGVRRGSWRCWPIANWTWQDVWAYIVLHDLPYLPSYDSVYLPGRDRSRSTNVMPFQGKQSASQRLGRIDQIKAVSPAAYQYLKEFYPWVTH